jgi:hypothetical protein
MPYPPSPTPTTLAPNVGSQQAAKQTAHLVAQLGHIALVVGVVLVATIVGLCLATVVFTGMRRWYHYVVVRPKLIHSAEYFELVARGDRPADFAGPAKVVTAALGDLAVSFRARLSVLRWSDGRRVHLGLAIGGTRNRNAPPAAIAHKIAEAIGAEAVPLDECPLPSVEHLAYASRSSFNGAGTLANAFKPDDVSLSALAVASTGVMTNTNGSAFLVITIKPIRTSERDALRGWFALQSQANESITGGASAPWNDVNQPNLFRGMVVAGADDLSVATSLTNIGPLLPQYESGLRSVPVSGRWPGALIWTAFMAMGVALAVVGSYLGAKSHLWVTAGIVIASVSLVGAIAAYFDLGRFSLKRMWGWLDAGFAPVPPRPLLALRRYAGAVSSGNERRYLSDAHPYRLVRRALVLTPLQMTVATALPPASSTATEGNQAKMIAAPVAATDAIGARIGYDIHGHGVQIPDGSRRGGTMVVGDPGTGKTTSLLSMWGADLNTRRVRYTLNGREWVHLGAMWIETKSEGAQRALDIARAVGYSEGHLLYIDVTRPEGLQLDLVVDWSDLEHSARLLAEAMRYAFKDRAIMDASEDTLAIALHLALAIVAEPAVLERSGEDPRQGFVGIAHSLLGGDPATGASERLLDAVSAKLGAGDGDGSYASMKEKRPAAYDSELGRAYRHYQSKVRTRKADTENVMGTPLTKVNKLLAGGSLWYRDPAKPAVTVSQIIASRSVSILNFGGERSFSDELRAILGGMTTYLVWDSVKKHCNGWDAEDLHFAFYCDELADIANDGADVIQRMFDQGRSRGLWPTFATQRFDQLPQETRNATLSAPAKVYLRQENPNAAREAVQDLIGEASEDFSAENVRKLPSLYGYARMRVNDTLQPAFTLHMVPDSYVTPRQLEAPGLPAPGQRDAVAA